MLPPIPTQRRFYDDRELLLRLLILSAITAPLLIAEAASIRGHGEGGERFPISCFSCASSEYEALYAKSTNLYSFGQPMEFNKACDNHMDLQNYASLIRCDSACVSVLEPQFLGGILNERKPYTFVRGCASDVFASATHAAFISSEGDEMENARDPNWRPRPRAHPAEIDYLHRAEICLNIPIQELWPDLFANSISGGAGPTEQVQVCSCLSSGCNSHDSITSGTGTVERRRGGGGRWMVGAMALVTAAVTMRVLRIF